MAADISKTEYVGLTASMYVGGDTQTPLTADVSLSAEMLVSSPNQSLSNANVSLSAEMLIGACPVFSESAGLTSEWLMMAARDTSITVDLSAEMTLEKLPVLVSIIVAGAASLDEKTTSQYTVTATFRDGSTRDVTAEATYLTGSIYADVVAGLLTAYSVDNDQSIGLLTTWTDHVTGMSESYLSSITILNVIPPVDDPPPDKTTPEPDPEDPCGSKGTYSQAIVAADEAATKAYNEWQSLISLLAVYGLQKTAVQKQIDKLEAIVEREAYLYCADYSTDLSGNVGTVEVNGVSDKLLITPKGAVGLGQLQPTLGSTPAAALYNYIMLPGWQKWKPTYRTGYVSNLDKDADTCTVTLDVHTTVQGLYINKIGVFDSVPIRYMTCNGNAFKNGDHVLIEFSDYSWNNKPTVVGFADAPRACPQLVEIKITSITLNSQFGTFCNQRIAELGTEKTYALELKDTFIPAYTAWLDDLEDRCKVQLFGSCWQRWERAELDRLAMPWLDWANTRQGSNHDQGYQTYVDSVDAVIARWNAAKNYFGTISTSGKADHTGGLDPDLDLTGAALAGLQLFIDCCQVDPIPAITTPTSGTAFQRAADMSAAAKTAYDSLDAACAPEMDAKLYVPSFFEWTWNHKGAIDANKIFYLLTTGYGYTFAGLPGGQIEALSIEFSVDDEVIFSYPTPVSHHVTTWTLQGKDETASTQIKVRIKGMLRSPSTSFGAYVAPLVEDPLGGVDDWGGPVIDQVTPDCWMWPVYRDAIEGGELAPRGFEDFAGRYPDHPIVTGRDAGTVTGGQESDLAYVNAYVHATYTYQADEESYDHWTFLSATSPIGDCEDFAITKIQMLLDRGWGISSLKLEVGYHQVSYDPKQYDTDGVEILKKVGHAWVVVNDTVAMNDTITTVGEMRAAYPLDGKLQVAGLQWRLLDSDRLVTCVPTKWYEYNLELCTFNAQITRREH